MTDKLPPNLLALFAPRPPLRYLPHADYPPEKRKTQPIDGVAAFLEAFRTPDPNYVPTESWLQRKDRIQQEKKAAQEQRLKDGLANYDPEKDPQVKGDPYKTLFVSRLNYETREPDLEREFGRFGPIERIRIVRNKETNKHRGYAFIVYEREKDLKAAYKETEGIRIKDRRVVVDVERGRTMKGWKPRRLGGGHGGRGYTKVPIARPSGPAGGYGGPPDRFGGGPPRGGGFRGGFRGGRGGGGFSGSNRFELGQGRGPRQGIGYQGGPPGGGGRFGHGGPPENGFSGEAPPNAPTGPGGRRAGGFDRGGDRGDRGDRGGYGGGYQGDRGGYGDRGPGGYGDRGGDRQDRGGYDRRGGGFDREGPSRDRYQDRGGQDRGGRDDDRRGGGYGGPRDDRHNDYDRKRPHDDGGYSGGGDRHRRRY